MCVLMGIKNLKGLIMLESLATGANATARSTLSLAKRGYRSVMILGREFQANVNVVEQDFEIKQNLYQRAVVPIECPT